MVEGTGSSYSEECGAVFEVIGSEASFREDSVAPCTCRIPAPLPDRSGQHEMDRQGKPAAMSCVY
jgi:hypothetical protein